MKLLIYEDSNVWGHGNYFTGEARLPREARWVQNLDRDVHADGLLGRIAGSGEKDARYDGRGERFLRLLRRFPDSSQLIVALGTNDLIKRAVPVSTIVADIGWYREVFSGPVMYIEPAEVAESEAFPRHMVQRREDLVRQMAAAGFHVIRFGLLETSDGLHLTRAAHRQVALRVKDALHAW